MGCPMWAHKGWSGKYLPEKLGRGEQIAAYASWCTSVEGNTTFYGLPSVETVATWAADAPSDFRFVFKVPRTVTHDRRLRDVRVQVREFLDRIEPLGERASTLWVQLPASFGPSDLEVLDRFLARMPAAHRYGVEVRHPSFFEDGADRPRLEDLLVRHGAEWISFDTTTLFSAPPTSDAEREGWNQKPRLPRRTAALSDEPVVRYVGRDDVEVTESGWQPWVDVVAGWLREGRRPTFFLHTPDNDDALWLARRFHDQVRALVPDVAPLPTPVDATPPTLF